MRERERERIVRDKQSKRHIQVDAQKRADGQEPML